MPSDQQRLPFKGVRVTEAEEEEEGWVLSEEQLSALRNSDALKSILRDTRLQQLLVRIDSADDRQKELSNIIENDPRFSSFSDTLLSTIGVTDYAKRETSSI